MSGGVGVVLIGFGEPEHADLSQVEGFLTRIFLANADLDPSESGEERARAMASARAPGLTEEYESIGGSPLLPQLRAQARAVEEALGAGGHRIPVTIATQFVRPSFEEAVAWAGELGLSRLIALPTYPFCGPSTTLAALEALASEVEGSGTTLRLHEVTGWHAHPRFVELWATCVGSHVAEAGVQLGDADTLLYFSAHGTPVAYLERVPYATYVEEACRAVADALGATRHALGYQNHGNRPIAWTQPDNQTLLPTVDARRVVVVPISFVHEQSETLVELDRDLAALASSAGLDFHRVGVPHSHAGLIALFVELIEGALRGSADRFLGRCGCRPGEDTWCAS